MHPELGPLLEENASHANQFRHRFDTVQQTQEPIAVTVCCSDSRVLQDHIWGNDTPGRLFTSSNIGNRVVQQTATGAAVSGDVLYPIVHAGTDLVIVMGHTGCGAVTAAYEDLTDGGDHPPGIAHCLDLLRPQLEPGVELLPPERDQAAAVNRLVEYNVDRQVEALVTSDSLPQPITVVGVVYDFQDVYSGERGEVHVINIDGVASVDVLRTEHPEIANRVERLWEYPGVADPR